MPYIVCPCQNNNYTIKNITNDSTYSNNVAYDSNNNSNDDEDDYDDDANNHDGDDDDDDNSGYGENGKKN